MAGITDITLKEILYPRYHWTAKKGFWPHTLRIFCLSLGIIVAALVGLAEVNVAPLKTWLATNIWYFLAVPFGAVAAYWLVFWVNRAWWKIIFSKKVNVVFAYNFETAPAFEAEYDTLVKQLRHQVAESNLGGVINIIKKPADIEFIDKTAAEAKTKLGLQASTLLVWGHPEKTRHGMKLFTLFSYEFGYPNFLSAAYAKSVFGKNIERALNSGLFGVNDFRIGVHGDMFGEYAIDTISFILGMMAASNGNTEKALLFFEEFRKRYSSQQDLVRKKAMGPAMGEVERSLTKINVGRATECYENEQYSKMWEYLEAAIAIDPYDYFTNMSAALYWEVMGDRIKAKHFTDMAEHHHHANQYEYRFNRAYFALDEGRYDDAVAIYNGMIPAVLLNPNHMAKFFCDKYQTTKNPVFLFGEGIVAVRWQDKKSGRKRLKDFIRKAKTINEQRYRALINAAESALVV